MYIILQSRNEAIQQKYMYVIILTNKQTNKQTNKSHVTFLFPDRHELPVLPGSPVIEGVAITTTPNTAYEMMKQGGRVGGEYEVVNSPPGGPPLSKDLEGMYEVPSPPSSHQPMPAIPLPVAPPTSGNVGGAGEEAVYESIPGDK